MKSTIFLLPLLFLMPGVLDVDEAPKQPATETDSRLRADGKGWRLDKAKITDSKRPRVLLIGDSILNGYLKHVVRSLDGKAYVDAWVNPYHQSEHVNKLLAEVLEHGPYNVVHFNMGLHGWPEGRIKPGTFEPLTKGYVEVLKAKLPNAKLIWASSTPVTVKDKPAEVEPDINPIIVEHNRLAAKVMAEMDVPVNDFYALLINRRELARGDRFHWTAPAYKLLADHAVCSILASLPEADSASEPASPRSASAATPTPEVTTTALIPPLFLPSSIVFAGDLVSSSGHRVTGCSSALISAWCGTNALSGAQPPYDDNAMRWTFDPRELVSDHDVVYEKPPSEPWEAMPVGGGDLSAMVRCMGGSLVLHLTKSDAWGFQQPPDAPLGSRFFNNVSPGTVTISLGECAAAVASKRFRQRLDLYRGRIVIQLGEDDERISLEIWGDPQRSVLLIAMDDPQLLVPQATVEVTEWRDSMRVWAEEDRIGAGEIHSRPARPHLANTGMQGYFTMDEDPLQGRGTAGVVGAREATSSDLSAGEKTASMRLAFHDRTSRLIAISCAVEPHGDPTPHAVADLEAVLAEPLNELQSRRDAWWKQWWDKSSLQLAGEDPLAKRLCGAYHVHLYTLGCTNRGPVPCKWDGGPGLMRRDERTWGLSEWVQEIRFTYMPLYTANRQEMAKGLTDHYTRMRPYLRRQTETMWGLDGLWIPETVLPWGHAEDFILNVDGPVRGGYYLTRDPQMIPYGKFEQFNGYVGLLFTAGLEICHHYLEFYDYFPDAAYLRNEAYPVVREVCRFVAHLLRKEDDGLYHLDPANALETWWLVRDPTDTLDGIRAIFPRFIALSEQYEADAELRQKCAEILAHLPQPPRQHWDASGKVTGDGNSYAPAGTLGPIRESRNFEIPALYRVYPFGLSGIGSANRDVCVHTFNRRIFGITNSWSLDAVWAARLGLADEAARLLGEHAQRYHRFPYGGWDSSNSSVWPDGLSACPYVDGAGLSSFCLQEMLLQSHEEAIRVVPATPRTWSGLFRFRARGGFLISACFSEGVPEFVEIESLLGRPLAIHHPWGRPDRATDANPPVVVRSRQDTRTVTSPEAILRFKTKAGEKLLLYEPGTS